MTDLLIICLLLAALAVLLSFTTVNAEQFASNDDSGPDECRNGLYRCVYRTIPFGF